MQGQYHSGAVGNLIELNISGRANNSKDNSTNESGNITKPALLISTPLLLGLLLFVLKKCKTKKKVEIE